jgi:hypothetical protein
MDTDEHGFSEMIFVVSLPLADTPFGGRFGLLQNVFFIRVHLCPSVVKTTLTASFRLRNEDSVKMHPATRPFVGWSVRFTGL